MSPRPQAKPHGQVRQSQVVTTFGPGALVDLPTVSVLIGGLDDWKGGDEVHEPRLIEKLRPLVGVTELRLYTPPPASDDFNAPPTGIRAWQFPEWYVTQDVEPNPPAGVLRTRLLVHRKAVSRGRYTDRDRRNRRVVPVRFVRACRKGHIGDIDWYIFVHRGPSPCKRQLWMDERGTSGDLSEIVVRCECGKERLMSDAAGTEARGLGRCDGNRPWLGPLTKETCGEANRLLVRTASNAYFPQVMRVISLPDPDEGLAQAVEQAWTYLEWADSAADVAAERRKPPVANALDGFSDEEVFREIQARRGVGSAASSKSVKEAELEVLVSSQEEIGGDIPDGNFYARALPRPTWDEPWMKPIERVVLLHRLREVAAQVGFTRFESSAPDEQGELEIGVQRAALARETTWLPAIENRGEGIFLGFSKEAIDAWLKRPSVIARDKELQAGFQRWAADHPGTKRRFPGLPYVMLHSLAHLLVSAVALECGYPASSIRERVYAGTAGYGILLYTGSPDAEGTLGGLVEVGRRISHHLRTALGLGELCSNDPVCAQHEPASAHERRFLLGAACHGCLLISETCCEQYNDFLDRALVVPTVDARGAEFFSLSVNA